MKLIQPYPRHNSSWPKPLPDRVQSPVPVYFIRYRYGHHAATSGYDRLCDYVGESIRLSKTNYWLGETVLRIPALLAAKWGGHFEYSRYDYIMEREAIRHFLAHHNSIYHFVYGEKSFKRLARFAGRNGNRIVCTVHHPASHHPWLFKKGMDHFRKVDLITVVSRDLIAPWKSIVGDGKVAWIPYAVDTAYFKPVEPKPQDRPPRCVFIGHHERDFETLPQVVEGILSQHPSVEFIMISKDPRCEPIARQNPRAQWYPRMSDPDYLAALQHADLLVLPLKCSTTNTAVLEAMACGLPVITNTGGIEEYLDPECSLLFPVGTTGAMSEAAVRLLRDPELKNRMSAAARRRALTFSWPSIAQQMVGLYKQLASD